MNRAQMAIPLWRILHLLSVCAWIGGGIGILLLLCLDCQATSGDELQTYNRVIDAVDDFIIAPGALATLATGLLLARARRLPVLTSPLFRFKLYATITAVVYGLWFVAPGLEQLLTSSLLADWAVFDDRIYADSFRQAALRSALQSVLVLGLLVVSVLRPRLQLGRRPADRQNHRV